MGRPPRRFEKYVLQRELDGDARHEVFLAEHEDGDEAILAFVDLDDATAAEIQADLERTSKLKHPAILPVTAMIEDGGRRALVHPPVNGRTLARLAEQLASDDEWIADVALFHIGQQLAAALATAQRGKPPVVHGCLTPERVIVTWEGKVQLLGLGSAAALPQVPAPPWLGLAAPEVRAGNPVTPEANTYALGAMLWWLATKTPPPEDGTPEGLNELRGDLSAIVRKAIERAVKADPAQRGKASMIAGALMREAKGGRDELKWNMEVFQALDRFDDVLPSSIAFPTSTPPVSASPPSSIPVPISDEPPSSERAQNKGSRTKAAAKAARPKEDSPKRTARKKEPPKKEPPKKGPPRPGRSAPPRVGKASASGAPKAKRTSARSVERPTSQEASTKPRPGMFDVGDPDEGRPPESDRTARMSMVELEEIARREQRTTHVNTLEEVERALDEEEAATQRSRETSPDIAVDIEVDDDDEPDDEARAAMFPQAETMPPASDDEPTKRVPLGVLKAQAEARMAKRAAETAGRPILLGSAADPTPPPVAPAPLPPVTPGLAQPPRPPLPSAARGPSLSFTLVIAVTAIAAFSAGIFVVRSWGDDAPDGVQPSAVPTTPPTPAPIAPKPAPTPAATAPPSPPAATTASAASPSATASASTAATAQPAPSAEGTDELPTPLYKHGLLRVSAAKAGATVYFRGKPSGPVGKILMVPCGAGFVRLGDDPLTKWYNDGRVLAIPCKKELVEVTMTVKPAFR